MSDRPTGAEAVCAYCGEPVLTGNEEAEHPLSAAINARLTTKTVCDPCNHWAGEMVDQPWLAEPHVASARFAHEIPDRRGNVLDRDPLLTGVADDGTRVTMGRDGNPIALNNVVERNEDGNTTGILAKDQAELDRLLDREQRKAEAAGKKMERGEPEGVSRQPNLLVRAEVRPGRWERMAAKALLGLLAETQDAAWRTSVSAAFLRGRMRDLERGPNDVKLESADAFAMFAAGPASAAVVMTVGERTFGRVSLMGIWMVGFELGDDVRGLDLGWVSDPLDPTKNSLGSLGSVIANRQGFA